MLCDVTKRNQTELTARSLKSVSGAYLIICQRSSRGVCSNGDRSMKDGIKMPSKVWGGENNIQIRECDATEIGGKGF